MEYLYSVQDLIALKGNRFSRNEAISSSSEETLLLVPLPGGGGRRHVLWCQRLWFAERIPTEGTGRTSGAGDGTAMASHSRLLGGALLVDSVPVAYTVGRSLEDTVMVHFEKALSSYNGAYQTINRMFLEESALPSPL